MSFLRAVTSSEMRAEELKTAWKSLSYDILSQRSKRHTLTPPQSPELVGHSNQHSSQSTIRTDERCTGMDPIMNSPCSCCPPPLQPFPLEYYNRQNLYYPTSSSVLPSPPLSHGTRDEKYHNVTSPLPLNRQNYYQSSNSALPNPPLSHGTRDERHHNMTPSVPLNRQNLYYPTNDSVLEHHNVGPLSTRKRKNFSLYEENEIDMKPKRMKEEEEVACQVHGILSLPGSREPRYNITVDELKRRVNQPECLTKVDMISYVRLAKNSARTLLDKHIIKTNQHNQRSEHTVLSKMSEAEVQVLAKGIQEINHRYFPGSWFARKAIQEILKNIMNARQQNEAMLERLKDHEKTKRFLKDIYLGLEARKDDPEMKTFNIMSHTFGVPNIQNHLSFILCYIDEELRVLEQNIHL